MWGGSDVRYSVALSYHVFQIKTVPLFVWKKYTVCTEFGDEKLRSASLESGSLDVLPSIEIHMLWVILLVFNWHRDPPGGLV